MTLLSNWKDVLTRAWSMKAIYATIVLQALAATLPLLSVEGYENLVAIAAGISQAGAALTALGAGVTRVLDQGIASGAADGK